MCKLKKLFSSLILMLIILNNLIPLINYATENLSQNEDEPKISAKNSKEVASIHPEWMNL